MKISVLENVGSGKTILANKLSTINKCNFYQIDQIVYDEENNKRTSKKQKEILFDILKENNYVIEGILRKEY